jgi:integrase
MAGKAGLTARAVEGAKAGPAHRDLVDGRGLVLRVHPSGRKVWMVRATDRRTGERLRREMGEYGEGPARLTLAQARFRAAEWRALIEAGTDPAKPHGALTVAAAVEDWLKDAGLRSEALVRRRMELHVLPVLGKRLLSEVEQRDVAALLRGLRHTKGLTAEVNRVRGSLSALWGWAEAQGEVRHNPVRATAKVPEPSLERERAGTVRVLSVEELAAIWRAAKADPSPIVAALVPLLILVPLRREEWTRATWDEMDVDAAGRWTLRLPASRMKGGRPMPSPCRGPPSNCSSRCGEGEASSSARPPGGHPSRAGSGPLPASPKRPPWRSHGWCTTSVGAPPPAWATPASAKR